MTGGGLGLAVNPVIVGSRMSNGARSVSVHGRGFCGRLAERRRPDGFEFRCGPAGPLSGLRGREFGSVGEFLAAAWEELG